jgi:hypothetical protein
MNERDRVIDQIACQCCDEYLVCDRRPNPESDICIRMLDLADAILALTKPDGTPAIGIISDDQTLPKEKYLGFDKGYGIDFAGFYRLVGGKK